MNKLTKKRYNPKTCDKEIFDLWQEERIYAFNDDSNATVFTIDTPPPYANAAWHMGGAIHYSGIDMIARYKRMQGYNVLFPMGLDRNGLPIEVQTEKKFNISMHQIPREEFLKKCKSILDEVGDMILNICRVLGFSNNSFKWEEVYKTDQPQYRALTQATFIQLFKDGLIYEDERPNNYCTRCKTTIADAEIDYESGSHYLYDIKFKIKETGEDLVISTTRPELIPAIGVVIYNPDDERYTNLEGKTAITPIFEDEVPIKAHHYAKMDFGTGIMMVCAYGDIADVQIFRELQLEPNTVIDKNGEIKPNVPKYKGMKIKEARKTIANDLEEQKYTVNKKMVPHNFPTCSRCHKEIEFLAMPEYYLEQIKYVDNLRDYLNVLNFYPKFMRQIWIDWLNTISIDWPISRRRYYGTEVPIWYCKGCGASNLPEPGPYYQPWNDNPPFERCDKCGSNEGFEGDERTFDTWMDSSISEIYTIKHPHNKLNMNLFTRLIKERDYIGDMRPQGKDIVRTWFHYTMLRAHQLYEKPAFKHVWISGHVVDKKGEKMSKSKGNIVKPEAMIERYGGDALRLFGALEASHGSDIRFNQQRLQGASKFINKFYNIARFTRNFINDKMENTKLEASDKWILSELKQTLQKSIKGYEVFDFHVPARELRNFTWDIFASHYIELVKGRAYNRDNAFKEEEQKSAHYTLGVLLNILTKAFAPIIPFVTDFIYRDLFEKSVHTELFPAPNDVIAESMFLDKTELIMEVNSAIWKQKKENSLPLNADITKAYLPEDLRPFFVDLRSMHSIKEIITEPKLEQFSSDVIKIDISRSHKLLLDF